MHLIKNESTKAERVKLSPSEAQRIKGECLARYAELTPELFVWVDCLGPAYAGDPLSDPESTGRDIEYGANWELMHGSPLRILIGDEYSDDPELLAELLIDAAAWMRRHGGQQLQSVRQNAASRTQPECPF